MAIVSISVVPVGTGNTSVSSYVAGCQKVLKSSKKIKYRLTPMATILEGELKEIMDVIPKLHNVPFERGAGRVLTTIIIDDRRDKDITMDGKLKSVADKL